MELAGCSPGTCRFWDALGEGVARRGGLHRRNEVSTMEVRSDRTPQPARGRKVPDGRATDRRTGGDRGRHDARPAVARRCVRRPDGGVAVLREPLRLLSDRWRLLRLPIVRGTPALLQSLAHGMRALRFSAAQAVAEDEVPNAAGMALASAVAIRPASASFSSFPSRSPRDRPARAGSRRRFRLQSGRRAAAARDIPGLSRVDRPLVRDPPGLRVPRGGALVVSAYEHGDPLTVAGARAHSTRHPRCGTNFLLVVVAVSVLVFSFIPGPSGFVAKFFSRLALLPVVAGIAFEVLRLGGRRGRGGSRCRVTGSRR